MTPVSITRPALESILASAEAAYPYEFFAYLGGNLKTGTIEELIFVRQEQNHASVTFRDDLLPLGLPILGSVHSHPNAPGIPSRADLRAFSKKGSVHFIAGYPFTEENLKAFTDTGKPVPYKTI
ncbi:MAG: Mov34/MPN/PAD-1 family protein [Candidatus Diapherotrites archaeon]|nr:Mov34/MPN/PAD-1 family protein [Candidatus Diapherotrites archaeon]